MFLSSFSGGMRERERERESDRGGNQETEILTNERRKGVF